MLCAMPVTVRIDGLGELLDQQLCVVSRGQLLDLGMKDTAMQWRVRAGGPWQALLPGVYLGLTGAPNLLAEGDGGAALRRAGQPHHRAGGPDAPRPAPARLTLEMVDVLVPGGRQRRQRRLRPTTPDGSGAGAIRHERAVADGGGGAGGGGYRAGCSAMLRDVRAVVADAVQRNRCTVATWPRNFSEAPIKGSAMFRSVLAEVADGIRSAAEADLRNLIRTARLPTPLYNASLYGGDVFIARPDAWWPEAGVTAEVDSRQWHLSPADRDRTRTRHDVMGAAGHHPAALFAAADPAGVG